MNLNSKLNGIIVVLVLTCIVVGGICAGKIFKGDDNIQTSDSTAKPTVITTPSPTPVPTMIPELVTYYEKNPDTIGWIKIDGTPIDYPVMFTPEDNEFYLNRDFDKNDSKAGTLYMVII